MQYCRRRCCSSTSVTPIFRRARSRTVRNMESTTWHLEHHKVVPARPHTIMPITLQIIHDTQDMRDSKSISRDIAVEAFGQQ